MKKEKVFRNKDEMEKLISEIDEEKKASGESLKVVAERHNLNRAVYYFWKKRLTNQVIHYKAPKTTILPKAQRKGMVNRFIVLGDPESMAEFYRLVRG